MRVYIKPAIVGMFTLILIGCQKASPTLAQARIENHTAARVTDWAIDCGAGWFGVGGIRPNAAAGSGVRGKVGAPVNFRCTFEGNTNEFSRHNIIEGGPA